MRGTDRFMVMSAHHNRLFSATIEHPGKGAWMEIPHAIDIKGIPVHAESAADGVAKGLLSLWWYSPFRDAAGGASLRNTRPPSPARL
jgi:hypothetical protein